MWMAVGAPRTQVRWMVLKHSLVLTALGVLIGTRLAMLVAQMLTSVLYGVTPMDLVSYVSAIFGVALVALVAGLIPAMRAASIDPLGL